MTYRIMADQELEKELMIIQTHVKMWRKEGIDNDAVRCRLMGYVSSGVIMHTPAQLERVFDLGFEEVSGNETTQTT